MPSKSKVDTFIRPSLAKVASKKSGLFSYLVLLTVVFFFLEVSFLIQSSGFYFGDFKMVASHLAIPLAIIPGVLFFIFAQFLVYLSFIISVWLVTRLISVALSFSWERTQVLGFFLWGIGLITILLMNQHYFPNSKFAELIGFVLRGKSAYLSFIFFSTISCIAIFIAFLGLLRVLFKSYRIPTFVLVVIVLLINLAFPTQQKIITDASTATKPNIIIIGVDSLRPDFLSYFGNTKKTPQFDEFLNHATVFANAMTPLARTFPAWVSILTGEYPKKTHVRFDLANQSELDLSSTLPAILRQHGYETIYAMDETRFSNVGTNFGFDHVLTPPVGLNDFLLGTFNDFPLSNLVVNTRMGKWLFPYSYANRPAFITYNPDSFLQFLSPSLTQSRTKPLFMAIHFCLPHFPYFYAEYGVRHPKNGTLYYWMSLKRAERQVQDFLTLLQQDGLLQHSIVILLSDHGEALELSGDRITENNAFISDKTKTTIPTFYPPSRDLEKINQSAGHGTDVLSLSQYHSMLAVRLYGMGIAPAKMVSGWVSLLDIKPTILGLLNISVQPNSGRSLAAYVRGQNKIVSASNDFFIESDFSPAAVRSVHPETRKLLFEGIDFFNIDPITTRIVVRKSMGDLIISSKQYADINGYWILAVYPQKNGSMMPILVNLKTGQWTNDLKIPFAEKSPAKHMLDALKHFYGSEIAEVI